MTHAQLLGARGVVMVPTIAGGRPSQYGSRCDPAVSDCTWYLLAPLLGTLAATAFAIELTELIMRWPDIRWPWSR